MATSCPTMAEGTEMMIKLYKRLNKTAMGLTLACIVFLVIANIVYLALSNDRWNCFIEYLLPFDIAGIAIAFATVYLSLDS